MLAALLDVPALTPSILSSEAESNAWCERLAARLNASGTGRARYVPTMRAASGDQPAAVLMARRQHGLDAVQTIPVNVLLDGELRGLTALAGQLDGLLKADARIIRNNRQQTVGRFAEVFDWLLEEAKRGRSIQRFKGLGEMNPDQLWETTVNPETRRLLQVRIEDAVAADEIFSTLMGDVVDPRRAFIEDNALKVANLDV